MRAWLTVMMLALAGCSVPVTGAPCEDDLQCPGGQRCVPRGEDPRDGTCVQGARTGEHLLDSCRLAMRTLAWRADECLGGTPASYLRLVAAESVCASVAASVQKGAQAFEPEQLGACLRDLRETSCGGLTLEDFTQGNLLDRCRALKPQVKDGGTCGSNQDCQDGWCDTASGCPGVCKRYVPAGAACDGSVPCQPGSTCSLNVCRVNAALNESCAWGLRCAPEANAVCVNDKCVARKTSGPCQWARECAPGYACVDVDVGAGADSPRECRRAKGLNEPCVPDANECGGLMYCDAATSRCQPWRESGQSCSVSLDESRETYLCLESRCDFGAYFQLVCQPYVAPGQACASDAQCGPTGACRNKVCVTTWCQ